MSETSKAGHIFLPEQFTGEIVIDVQHVPISLTASAGPSGRLELNVEPISLSDAPSGVRALLQSFSKPGNLIDEFGLECETSDGKKRLTSDSVHLVGFNPSSDGWHVKLRTGEASLRMPAPDTHDRPMLRFHLLGFECFPAVCVKAELGSIVIRGETQATATDKITGWIAAQGPDGCQPMSWRKSAEHMLKHLRSVLGFARGAPLPLPISEFSEGDTVEVTFHETGEGYAPMMPPIPHLNLGPIAEAAVNNITAADAHRDAFELAVGWLLVPTTYEEVRFLAGMTALESLASGLLEKSKTSILGSSASDKFAKRVRALVNEQDFDDSTKKAIKDKIPELNRRSFVQKIEALLEQQQVDFTSTDDAKLARLAKLRNAVVHQGAASEDEDLRPSIRIIREMVRLRNAIVHRGAASEDKDLWPYILIIREILVRIVLSMLKFDETYQCYIGGCHMRRFPDCQPVN